MGKELYTHSELQFIGNCENLGNLFKNLQFIKIFWATRIKPNFKGNLTQFEWSKFQVKADKLTILMSLYSNKKDLC
jgi:hypothetical protein